MFAHLMARSTKADFKAELERREAIRCAEAAAARADAAVPGKIDDIADLRRRQLVEEQKHLANAAQ